MVTTKVKLTGAALLVAFASIVTTSSAKAEDLQEVTKAIERLQSQISEDQYQLSALKEKEKALAEASANNTYSSSYGSDSSSSYEYINQLQ